MIQRLIAAHHHTQLAATIASTASKLRVGCDYACATRVSRRAPHIHRRPSSAAGLRMSNGTMETESVPKPSTLPLVDPRWLAEHLDNPRIKLVDASWYPPNLGPRDTAAEFRTKRIGKNCVFFDIDTIADTETTSLPHMLPSEDQFSEALSSLGISQGDFVVVYDSAGLLSAPRAWWTFKALGMDDVGVLDGGLPEWQRLGFDMEADEPVTPRPTSNPPKVELRKSWVVNADQVLEMVNEKTGTILDARPPPRFLGEADEPRPCLRRGHIPGSRNVPFPSVSQPEQFKTGEMGPLKGVDDLKAIFGSVGVTQDTNVICSCGSGTTAAVLVMAMHVAGFKKTAVYDGSWAEWGNREDLPIEK